MGNSKKKRKNWREVKSAIKGHEQHTCEFAKQLCSLNSPIHLTNRHILVSLVIFFSCLPSSCFRNVSYTKFLEFDALALSRGLV